MRRLCPIHYSVSLPAFIKIASANCLILVIFDAYCVTTALIDRHMPRKMVEINIYAYIESFAMFFFGFVFVSFFLIDCRFLQQSIHSNYFTVALPTATLSPNQ